MNYLKPREMRDTSGNPTGRWHYTQRNDDRIWPIGYCADGCPGHQTSDEAREHFRVYVLDHELDLDGHWAGVWHRCQAGGCDVLTDGFVRVRGWPKFDLCDEHRTREVVESLMPMMHDSIES